MSLVMHCLVLFPLCVGDLSPRWLRLLSGLILLIHFLLWLPLFAGGGGVLCLVLVLLCSTLCLSSFVSSCWGSDRKLVDLL